MIPEIVAKNTQDLAPGDWVLNIGRVEKVQRRTAHGNSNYYWLQFERPSYNRGATPLLTWYCMKNPPATGRTQGENVGGVTIT